MDDDDKTLKDYRVLQDENSLHQLGVEEHENSLQEALKTPMQVLQPGGLRSNFANLADNYYANQKLDYTEEAAETGFGTDRRDKAIGLTALDDTEHSLEDYRSKAQSSASKLFNGAAKFVPVMATTFADGIAGTIAGAFNTAEYLGESIASGEKITRRGFFNSFIDNPISQKLLSIQDYFEKVFPNYYSDAERDDNGKWWTHINANMIGDQFIKNLGFTAGAMLSGMVSSGVSQSLRVGSGKAANNIMKAAASASAGDAAAEQGLRKVALNKANNAAAIRESQAAARSFRKTGIFDQIAGGVGGAMGEARIEALHAANEFYDPAFQNLDAQHAAFLDSIDKELFEEHPTWYEVVDVRNADGSVTEKLVLVNPDGQKVKQEKIQEAQEQYDLRREYLDSQAARVANTVFALNVPLLTFDNVFEFGKLFGGGFNTLRKQMRTVRRVGDKYVGRGTVAGAIGSGLANALVEGFEEINQKVISEGAKDIGNKNMATFYNDGKDINAINGFARSLASMLQSGVDVYADPSSWQEFTIGALTGSISLYMGKDANGKARWAGGIGATIKDRLDDMKSNADMAKTLNDYIATDKFKDLVHAYTRQTKYADIMADAAEVGNKFVFHNAESKSLINLVAAFHKAGRTADLKEFVDRFSTLSDADVADVRTALAKNDGSNITDASTDAEVRDFVKQRVEDMKRTIESYTAAYDAIASQAPIGTSDDVLTEYAFTVAQLDNFDHRFMSLWEGEEGKPGVRDRLRSFFNAEAEHAVDNEGHPLSEEAKKEFADKEMKAAESLLRGSNILDVSSGSVVDELSSSSLMRSLRSIKAKLEKKNAFTDKGLIEDVGDMIQLISARKNYYRALADPAHNILTHFDNDAKSDEQAREEATEQMQAENAAAVPEFKTVQELRDYLNDPALSDAERKKRSRTVFGKKGSPIVDRYKKMWETTRALKKNASRYSKSDGTVNDAAALFDYVLHQEGVTDIRSLYDFELPKTMDPEDFNAILKQYGVAQSRKSAVGANPFSQQMQSKQEAEPIDPAVMSARYEAARNLYEKTVNETKKGNVVAGRTNEYGEPVATETPAAAEPAKPSSTPKVEDPTEKPEKKAEPEAKPEEKKPEPSKETPAAPDAKPEEPVEPKELSPEEQQPKTQPLVSVDEEQSNPTTIERDLDEQEQISSSQTSLGDSEAHTKTLEAPEDGKDRDTEGKVLYEESAIPDVALEDFTSNLEGETHKALRRFEDAAYEKLQEQIKTGKRMPGAGDYRAISGVLRKEGAFDFVNQGKLKYGSVISFAILPESFYSNGRTDNNGNPIKTIFMMHKNQVVGVLRDEGSTYRGKDIYGHKELHKAILAEYKDWKKKHDPEAETFEFSKKSRVWRLRKGRLVFTDQNKPIGPSMPGFSKNAPIAYKTKGGDLIAVKGSQESLNSNTSIQDRLKDKNPGFYYITKNADGSLIPVRLSLAHFNKKEAPGMPTSKIYQGVHKILKDLFDNPAVWDVSTEESANFAREAREQIGNLVYTGNLRFSFGTVGDMVTFRISRSVLDEEGNPKKTDKGNYEMENLVEVERDANGAAKTSEELADAVIEGILDRINPQIQVDMRDVASAAKSMKSYIDAGYVSANVESLTPAGASFYIDPYDPVTRKFMPVFEPEERKAPQEELKEYIPEDDDDSFDNFSFNMSTEQAGKHTNPIDLEKELEWLDRVLPNISEQHRLDIKKGLLNMRGADGHAYGNVTRGIMTLSEDAVEGTAYHEAFHWVSQYILSDEERKQVYQEARKVYGKLGVKALEEKLADDFREWMLTGAPKELSLRGSFEGRNLIQGIVEFFRRLYQMVTHSRELMPYTLSIFQSINTGEYASRTENFNEKDTQTIIAENVQKGEQKVREYSNPHIVKDIHYVAQPDGTVRIEYEVPNGQLLRNQDYAFPEDHIKDAIQAIKDLYAHGFGLDLSAGLSSIYYSEEEGFIFSTVMPSQTESVGETLADFYSALGKTGLNFKYLETQTKAELATKGVTEEQYDKWSQAEKEHTLKCIGV